MSSRRFTWLCVVLALILGTTAAYSQAPTASISGRVTNEGLPLPGASVTATSPNLQGTRTAVTSGNGDYFLPNLPPGQYTIRMALSGFQTKEETLRLGASQAATVNGALSLKGLEAATVVTARSEQVSTTTQAAATYTSETLAKLPTARTMIAAIALAPGVNGNGPNGAVTIAGAPSYDNVMTVNGASVQDNVRGTPNTLFVEDAIQETTTITSGVSAEYGRFTGGVVNAVTKSGGNKFSGSFRTTFINDDWSAVTPYGEAKTDKVVPTYEATLGGPFWKDRIWFFGAFRSQKNEFQGTTAPPASQSFPRGDDEQRYEGKLTISPIQNHTLTGSYMRIDRAQAGYYFTPLPILDVADSTYDRELPQELWVGSYNGVLTDTLFFEGQYSSRAFTFVNSGGKYTDLVKGTPFLSFDPFGFYNSPIFCAVCPGSEERRDNEQFFGKATYFLSTKNLGSHNIVLGYDNFTASRQSNNYQSGSAYFINGNSVIYQNGDLYPVLDEGSYLGFYPILNAAQPTDENTQAVFLNDTWKINNNLSANIGVRYDKNKGTDSRGIVTADDSNFSPRLAVTFDPTGNGSLRLTGTYAKYVGALVNTAVGAGSSFGSPASFGYYYTGPSINTDPSKPLMTRAEVAMAVFAWFGITAPGQFPSSQFAPDAFVSIPGVNSQIREALKSPNVDEFTLGAGGTIGPRLSYRVEGVYRNFKDFYVSRTDMSTGQVSEDVYTGRVYDLSLVENTTDPLSRKYYGLHTNFNWRALDSLNVGGSWTWSHNYGNFVGENTGSGPVRTAIFAYPEYRDLKWNAPNGDLPQDQRHRVRVFATWDAPLPESFGHLAFSFIHSLDTGLPYGASGGVASYPYVTNPGYVSRPGSVTYFYTARDAFRTPTVNRTDISLNYGFNIGPVEIFVQPQVLNAFNNQTINANDPNLLSQAIETSVNRSANYDRFNPFTETPVMGARNTGANWGLPSSFGTALSSTAYQLSRRWQVSVGVRF